MKRKTETTRDQLAEALYQRGLAPADMLSLQPEEGVGRCQEMCTQDRAGALKGFLQSCRYGKVLSNTLSSADELLRTIPSPSPLTLLNSAFGIDVSDSLHALNTSDGKLELSGYISTPCNSLAIKAFQYFYINSQFICKGPIQKLLNQLASSFECWEPGTAVVKSHNRKISRSQAFPVYVLNLSCPQSLYDLNFEPSKTYVEFKDWVPVLNFIEKVIQSFWKEKISYESVCHGADIPRKGQMWEEPDIEV